MGEILDIRNFPDHVVSDEDKLLMTDARNAHGAGSATVGSFMEKVIKPLIASECMSFAVMTGEEYEALERKEERVFYVILENGKFVRSYVGSLPLTQGEVLFRTDADGYWQVSRDGGKSYVWMLSSDGRKVLSHGPKGDAFRFEDFTPEQLESLKGGKGDKGDKGDAFRYEDFTPKQLASLRGEEGKSAYEVAVANGFAGTAAEWLVSLKGEKGDTPVITAERDTDGKYYWKVDGEWLLDNGQKVPATSEGGGSSNVASLGDLTNVDETVDAASEEDVVLFRAKGATMWNMKRLSEIGGGGGQTTIQRNVRVVNNLESKNISASKGEPCLLNFTFVSQERYNSEEVYENTGERGLLQVSVRNSDKSEYVVVKQMYIQSDSPFSIDVAEFLTSGANNVMIKVTGEVTEVTTPAFVYTVTLTSLSISADNFRWWTAYTGDVTLPLSIGGNISKVLHVTVTGKDYNRSYEVQIGTSIYVETAYNYAVEHPGVTGVYEISAYVSSVDGIIRTRMVSFNVMCVVAGERVKLVAVNNVLPKATNWTENALFDYAMYDGDEVTTGAQFVVKKEGMPVFTSNEDSINASSG